MPEASQLAIIAVLHGARLTGATALRFHGVWAGVDNHLHLQVPPNAHRVLQAPLTPIAQFHPPKFVAGGTLMHWVSAGPSSEPATWLVPVTDALAHFARVESDEQVVAAIESAVHEKRMSRSAVPGLLHRLPRRQHRLATRLTFLAGSGMETIARMRLEEHGFRIAQQVQIGIDRVDLVIDNWLIIELDGDEWHDPVEDRIRTNRLIRTGHRVLRFGYKDLFERWHETLETVLELLGERRPQVS